MLLRLRKITVIIYLVFSSVVCAEKSTIETLGDVGQIILPISSLGLSFLKAKSNNQRWPVYLYPLLKSYGAGVTTVYGAKFLLKKERPNGEDFRSLPSGHAYMAFAGASYNQSLYGWKGGIPSFLAASFVGFSRIYAQKHFAGDVVAASSIALLYNWYFAGSFDDQSLPEITISKKGDVKLGVTTNLDNFSLKAKPLLASPLTFNFSLGPTYVDSISFLKNSKEIFGLFDLSEKRTPVYAINLGLRYRVQKNSLLYWDLSPFENISHFRLKKQLNLSGKTFNVGEKIKTDWRQYNAALGYEYSMNWGKYFLTRLRGGIYSYFTKIKLKSSSNSSKKLTESFLSALPYLGLGVSLKPFERFLLGASFDHMSYSEQKYNRFNFSMSYRPSQYWSYLLSGTAFSRTLNVYSFIGQGKVSHQSLGYALSAGFARHFF